MQIVDRSLHNLSELLEEVANMCHVALGRKGLPKLEDYKKLLEMIGIETIHQKDQMFPDMGLTYIQFKLGECEFLLEGQIPPYKITYRPHPKDRITFGDLIALIDKTTWEIRKWFNKVVIMIRVDRDTDVVTQTFIEVCEFVCAPANRSAATPAFMRSLGELYNRHFQHVRLSYPNRFTSEMHARLLSESWRPEITDPVLYYTFSDSNLRAFLRAQKANR